MTDHEQQEIAIEAEIYRRAPTDAGFAIAYALIQVAAALNRLGDEMPIGVNLEIDRDSG